MARRLLQFVVRTPHTTVLDIAASSVRVLTETGHVGLRTGTEAMVLPIETGLVIVRSTEGVTLVGCAGGLLSSNGKDATLLTPLAVMGRDPASVERALADAVTVPDSELAARARLGKLEHRILDELRRGPRDGTRRAGERP